MSFVAITIVTYTATALAVGAGIYEASTMASKAKRANSQALDQINATQAITGTVDPSTTVDPTANNQNQINQLGRAALISTSPQGVQGTDNVGRYRLLGN